MTPVADPACPRCAGTGFFESDRRRRRKGRGIRAKCDCTFDWFGRRK